MVSLRRTIAIFSLSLEKEIHTACAYFGFLCGFLFVQVREKVKMAYLPSLKAGIIEFKNSFVKIRYILIFV